jgi:membrane-bound lytic murein transglycosylase D
MAIDARFVPVVAGLMIVLAPAYLTPADADTIPSLIDSTEHAAVPPEPDPFDPTLVQDPDAEGGSVALGEDAEVEADVEADVAVELEPWVEELAEAARPTGPPYDVVVNEKVQYFMDRYTGERRAIISLWFDRSTRYLDMIRETFRARGLPEDLAFVAMIESGFNPKAVSRAGAKGMWQFMAATARRYGLRVDQWVDERYDPIKSTSAAAAYLRDLYALFGSWSLAKAGYNAGEMKVARAIRLTGTSDFWELARSRFLKQETKDFVPAIHAATVIGRDPSRYGFEPGVVETPVTDSVSVPARMSLKVLAAKTDIPFETLRALNPVLIKATTPPGNPYMLTVPDGTAERVQAALAPPRRPAATARVSKVRIVAEGAEIHVVQPSETVKGIAQRYGVTVASLMQWNKLADPDRIRPGDRLRVSEAKVSAEPAASSGPR